MLVEITTREDLEKAWIETSEELNTVYFPYSIRGYLDGSFPESPIRLFTFPANTPHKYWFMIKDNVYIKPYCMIAQATGSRLDLREFTDCLREFRVRALGALDSNRPHLLIGKEELVKVYTTLMRNVVCDLEYSNLNLNLFYMDERQKRKIMRQQIELPDGYYFDEIDPLEEGELINSTWQHAKEGDLDQTIAKLARLPSACIRREGKPVAFEMVDPAGFFNNQFVFEEHRRKGLGTAVETWLSHKCIRRGMTPFKTVDKRNTVVMETSEQSPYWTQWEDVDGPTTVLFQEWFTADDQQS